MAPSFAFVTLLTSDNYLPGALTLFHSLIEQEKQQPGQKFDTVVMVTPDTVSSETIKSLQTVCRVVIGVDEITSQSTKELALLGRADLSATLTKLQAWRLTNYKKIVFLDADMLVLRSLSHLFEETAPFSAAPDLGWPDCFNSGFFVFSPSVDTFDALTHMSNERGTWDGGDQGLLNDYFENWNKLSFCYNCVPTAFRLYEPAVARYGHNISVIHYNGKVKPWNLLDGNTRGCEKEKAIDIYGGLLPKWISAYETCQDSSIDVQGRFEKLEWEGKEAFLVEQRKLLHLKAQKSHDSGLNLSKSGSSSPTSSPAIPQKA